MANPICLSPLKFYDSLAKQSHRKSYAYGHISPLLTKMGWLPPFQFVIPSSLYNAGGELVEAILYNAKTDEVIGNKAFHLKNAGFTIKTCENYKLACYDSARAFIENVAVTGTYTVPIANTHTFVGNIDIAIAAGEKFTIEIISRSYTSVNGGRVYVNAAPNLLSYLPSDKRIYVAEEDINRLCFYDGASDTEGTLVVKVTRELDSGEGLYYLKLASANEIWCYYSEVFCFTNVTQDYLELEYWNETGNFAIKNGVISFLNGFHFKMLLKCEIGKPEYNFEEESTKRLGYVYIESQVSKKTYKFNVVVPEYICDALRIVRLCDNKIIRYKDDEYEAISFEMEADWQTQGDLASVTCEFETDNVIANIGGFVPDKLGGDYNNDYDDDFDKE